MNIEHIPFLTTNWSTVPVTEHPGLTGKAFWRTQTFGAIRVRMVEYTPNYEADHWCEKGHIVLCLDSCLETYLATGERVTLNPGMSYQVADGASSHKSVTATGAKLFIVD